MKYIRNREQFRYTEVLLEEAPSNQIYDGTWEDTFIGRFFSFLGRKVTHKMKKGRLNKLLNQMQRELEKSQFKTIEGEPLVQTYQVYQNIVIIKSYIKNSNDFNKDDLISYLDMAIDEHTEQSENESLPTKIREAHTKVLKGMKEVLDYTNSLLSNVNESSNPNNVIDASAEIVDRFFDNTFQQLTGNGGAVKLSTYQPSVTGYKSSENIIRSIISDLISDISSIAGNNSNTELAKKEKEFLKDIKDIPYDDYASFSNYWSRKIIPMVNEIKILVEKERKSSINSNKEDSIRKSIEGLTDDTNVYIKWYSDRKKDNKYGYISKDIASKILDNDTIDMEKWDEIKDDPSNKIIYIKTENGGAKKVSTQLSMFNPKNFIQIGDVIVKHKGDDDKDDVNDDFRINVEDKMDEVFPNDSEYKRQMTISKTEMDDLQSKMKSKVEDQKDVVDPIAILKIFNRAYNSFTITKEEFNDLSNKYSPRVASRKKAEYELIGDSAREKKLFQEWNDGVLSMLQQYGDFLSSHTKKFIIKMLDDNHLFGNNGAQAKLLSEYFNVPLDDIKKGMKDTNKPGEHRSRITEDNTVKFSSVNNVEMNTDKIRRVPFIMEIVNGNGERKMMSVFPITANKGRDSSSLKVKYSSGNDYGFLLNYMQGINVDLDTGLLEDMGMNGEDNSPVYTADFISDNGFLEKNKRYKLTNIRRVTDDKGYGDENVEISKIFMLLGAKDEGLYRLPSLNDKMKQAINASKNDKLI